MGALDGLRILDLSRVLAGPFCTMMLGDHGADVIKVESLTGDETRQYGPPFVDGQSTYFMAINRNKRSIAIDLTKPAGREIIRRLAMSSDVLIENFRTGTMERWGLGWQQMRELNPRLIYCAISGFGRSGPLASVAGYDGALQAFAGLMSINGDPQVGPTKVGVAVGDMTTGLMASQAILLALHARERTGLGQFVEVSLLESLIQYLHPHSGAYLNAGVVGAPHGNSHPMIAPYDLLPTADRPIYLPGGNNGQWRKLSAAIGRPELADDERFRTNQDRVANRAAMLAELTAALSTRGAAEWCERLWAAGVPAGPVNRLNEIMAHEQVHARSMVMEMAHPALSQPLRMTGIPAKLHGTPGSVRQPPPLLSEHAAEILGQLGYGSAEIEALRADGAVRIQAD